ncbi:ABC transporter substrate-binding protein [Phytoactinopolyspora endophytica]|uniref:ABC transporter substrate-binding protein n=1 Tax=Phytoactinopolyspora endophytica TaxID=1642495 RepID=UPI00101B7C5E|nr:ABC transporter substrate-binding protein [Phytoactinopolyspora endophytica]
MPVTGSELSNLATSVSRRRFLQVTGAAGMVVAGGLLAACGGDDDADTASGSGGGADEQGSYGDVTLQLSWVKNVQFVGPYMALEGGYYEDAGFSNVELGAGGPGGTPAEAALSTGQAWIGVSSPLIAAPAILEGAEIKLVGATYQKNPFCIVSLEENPIPDPQAMIGKRIGVGDANDLVWTAFLAANDIDPADVERVPFQSDPTPLTVGEIDGYVGYATAGAAVLNRRGFAAEQILFADHGLSMVGESLAVLQQTIDDDREQLKAFLAATIRGWRDALADPDEATRLTVEKYGVDQNFDYDEQRDVMDGQAELIESEDTGNNGLFTVTSELMDANVAALQYAGIEIGVDELFDLSVLDEVYSENPDLI